MAGEELSAGPATRNYEPLYFCGDASLSNQAAVWKDISALFSPLSFQNTLSEPWGRAQAHHNVSLPCLSTAAVRSTTVPQKYLKLHSCYTVGELYDFFFFLFQSANMYQKEGRRLTRSQRYTTFVWYSGKKSKKNMCTS